MTCVVGGRCGSDLMWLWLWCLVLAAGAPIQPPAWELPHATGVTLKKKKKKSKVAGLAIKRSDQIPAAWYIPKAQASP